MSRLIKYVAFLLLACGGVTSAWASCTPANGYTIIYPSTAFSPPAFNPQNYAVGDVIYTTGAFKAIPPDPGLTVNCTESWYLYGTGLGATDPGAFMTYATSIPGVGLRFSTNNGGTYYPSQFNYSGYLNAAGTDVTLTGSTPKYSIKIDLVKTGAITAGGTLTGPFAQWRENTAGGPLLAEFQWPAGGINIVPMFPTCSVTTTSIAVALGQVKVTAFSGVGSTSPATNFAINLSCSVDGSNPFTNVYVTLTDAVNPGNTSNILSLVASSTAKGVGVQVLRNTTVLSYGPDSAKVGNTNQWKAGSLTVGTTTFTIPLSARFTQTLATITPGSVWARATFTMSYQ